MFLKFCKIHRKIPVPESQTCNFIKKRLWHRCFPVNFAKFLWTTFLKNTSGRLFVLLIASQSSSKKSIKSGTVWSVLCDSPCFRFSLCTHYRPLQYFSTYFWKSNMAQIYDPNFQTVKCFSRDYAVKTCAETLLDKKHSSVKNRTPRTTVSFTWGLPLY